MKETKKQNLWIKKLRKNKYLPFILLFIAIAFIHIFMKNIGDDGYFKSINFHELIIRYKSWSSRVVIEFFLIIIAKQNINIWKIIDSIVYTLLAITTLKLVNPKKIKAVTYLGCLLFLCYPYLDMNTAGWVATTCNYLWCASFGILSFLPLINKEQQKTTNKITYLLSLLACIYATNQEQMCAIIFGMNLLYLIYHIYKEKKLNSYNVMSLLISIISMIFIFTCPGNASRTIKETKAWFPEFKNYSLAQKIYLGIVPTVNVLLKNQYILLLFTIFLGIGVMNYAKEKSSKIIASTTVIIISLLTIGKGFLIEMFPKFQEIFTIFNQNQGLILKGKVSIIPLCLSIVIICALLYMILVIFQKQKLLPFFIFTAGLCSRFIMGFSPTIFASNTRTAIFLYLSMIIVILYVVEKLYKDKKINSTQEIWIFGLIIAYALFNYINTFININV